MKEYKAVKVKWDVYLENLNKELDGFTKDGWEVVNVTIEPPNTLNFVVVLCREV